MSIPGATGATGATGGSGGPARLHGPVEVVGTGLLGTSIALACRRAGLEVLLTDTTEEHLRTASQLGAGRPRRRGPPPPPPGPPAARRARGGGAARAAAPPPRGGAAPRSRPTTWAP